VTRANPLPGVDPEQDRTVRAARLLQRETGCAQGVDIHREKRLPKGGGLGGGSADAATVLQASNRLWELKLPRAELERLGLQLGADVPVFVYGRSAFAEGVGEVLHPVDLPPAWYAVLVPPVHVPTPEIFGDRELTRNTIPITIAAFLTGMGHNDLEPVVCRRHPQVAEYLEWLKGFGDARMTGSGACVFAAFATRDEAEAVMAAKPDSMGGFMAQGMDRHPLYDFAD